MRKKIEVKMLEEEIKRRGKQGYRMRKKEEVKKVEDEKKRGEKVGG